MGMGRTEEYVESKDRVGNKAPAYEKSIVLKKASIKSRKTNLKDT